jgi:hypothetical protein
LPGKPICLLALVILAGCGGSTRSNLQTVRGDGYRFEAPAVWTAVPAKTSEAVKHGAVDLMEVLRFRLEKPYRVARFAAVARELDNDVAQLARQGSARITSRATVSLAGRKARSYSLEYGEQKIEEIAFVLEGQNEYQLLCRRAPSAPDTSCQAFFASFTLT